MKDIHLWAPWFRELAQSISAGGEDYLVEKAKAVNWSGTKPTPLVSGEDRWIDPFSFLSTLAQKATTRQLPVVYPSVDDVFHLTQPLPDPKRIELFIFPVLRANVSALFHPESSKHFSLLWRLFRQVVKGVGWVSGEDYKAALQIKRVGPTKLSYGLFFADPYQFLPVDGFSVLDGTAFGSSTLADDHSYEEYLAACVQVKNAFPGCDPFEINHFLFSQQREQLISSKSSFFHISTNVDRKRDWWNDFVADGGVFTGGKASRVPWDVEDWDQHKRAPYPLRAPQKGDIILVRYGMLNGRGIGVVIQNDYAETGGLNGESRIHVLWLNKSHFGLAHHAEQRAFNKVDERSGTYRAFAESDYGSSVRLIRQLMGAQEEPSASNSTLGPESDGMFGTKNQILYGPPGTGKTWNTVARAVAIVEGKDVEAVEKERENHSHDVKDRFDVYCKSGQVAMVTFHQNYAYEDFVEGIRPVLSEESDAGVDFVLRWGIFRELAETAERNWRASRDHSEHLDGDGLVDSFLDFVEAGIEDGQEFVLEVPGYNYRYPMVEVVRQGHGRIRLRGPKNGLKGLSSLVWRKIYRDRLDEKIKSYQDIRGVSPAKGNTHTNARFHYAMLQRLRQYRKEWEKKAHGQEERKNFVLILDEINRGNIARIFGELITLVEESRRIGREDETTVTLPNSGEEFGVPENLYLIGTMNTADRSIALLDTALRRRFEFVEMMPDPDHPEIGTNIDGVDLRQLLKVMNERICFLRDREHQIGHTYFLNVRDLEGLKKTFQKQVLPLLQEYFYDDWAKIRAVLGKNGFIESRSRPEELAKLVDSEARAYEVLGSRDPKWDDRAQYRQIYGANAAVAGTVGGEEEAAETGGEGN